MRAVEEYPNAVPGLSAAGVDELRATMGTFADWQLREGHRFDPAADDAAALAEDLVRGLAYPEHAFDPLSAAAQDRVALALGLPARADWAPAHPVPEGTPSYRMPSWEGDVYEVLFRRQADAAPEPRPRPDPVVGSADQWPELASVEAWAATRATASIGKAIARRLGEGWSPSDPYGELRLPVLTRGDIGLDFVVVPGGELGMGLSKEDRAQAARVAKAHSPEAVAHLTALTRSCRPVRRVHVQPFLCARTPLLDRHGPRLDLQGDAANPHGVLRVASSDAAATPEGFRLPSEGEWEWLARRGTGATWLFGDEDPQVWAPRVLSEALTDDGHPFGVHGLGWGEWTDDGWHPTYRGAPSTSHAWDPMSRPEVVRGGCLALWPWQSAEVMLALTAGRDRAGRDAAHAVRLVRDLPPR